MVLPLNTQTTGLTEVSRHSCQEMNYTRTLIKVLVGSCAITHSHTLPTETLPLLRLDASNIHLLRVLPTTLTTKGSSPQTHSKLTHPSRMLCQSKFKPPITMVKHGISLLNHLTSCGKQLMFHKDLNTTTVKKVLSLKCSDGHMTT